MQYLVLKDERNIRNVVADFNRASRFLALDIETTGLDSFQDEIVEFQFSGDKDEDTIYIAASTFVHCLHDIKLPVMGHNLRFDLQFLFRKGVDLTHLDILDTMLIGHLIDENREFYTLDSYIGEMTDETYKKEFWEKYKTYSEAPEKERHHYAAKDVWWTRRLFEKLEGLRQRQGIPYELVTHVGRLQRSLLHTEINGIKIDLKYLTDKCCEVRAKIDNLIPKMRETASEYIELAELEQWTKQLNKRSTDKGKSRVKRPVFNFDSPKQLNELLYNKLGLPVQKSDAKGNATVDDAALQRISTLHKIIPAIQEYRGLSKVYGTYLEGTLDKVRNGRIYPEFRVSGTVTGRIAHANPNLGQLPREGGIRGIYIPEPGYCFISADYSSLEVYIEAAITGDPQLGKIISENTSKHDITSKALGVDRDTAKTLNFALQYWASHYKVAKLLKTSLKRGQEIWNEYWKLYKGPKELKSKTDKMVDTGEALVSIFGRRRRFEIRKRHEWDTDYRQAYNFLIQSTGADITSRAFYKVCDELQKNRWGRGLFTVHDEILIEVKKELAKEAEQLLLMEMIKSGKEAGFDLKAVSSGEMSRWND